ncbi:hypothetical protein L915_07655 [Phytophthora nicotianae]|uniref:Uncharacterized protein n=2 Tax=Phytophthora nicotianae TaxID=4792 RepID=W2GYF3_PHYNI|nr:hypothetical protein L915_07655 [Phytophthora nicotianae]
MSKEVLANCWRHADLLSDQQMSMVHIFNKINTLTLCRNQSARLGSVICLPAVSTFHAAKPFN